MPLWVQMDSRVKVSERLEAHAASFLLSAPPVSFRISAPPIHFQIDYGRSMCITVKVEWLVFACSTVFFISTSCCGITQASDYHQAWPKQWFWSKVP